MKVEIKVQYSGSALFGLNPGNTEGVDVDASIVNYGDSLAALLRREFPGAEIDVENVHDRAEFEYWNLDGRAGDDVEAIRLIVDEIVHRHWESWTWIIKKGRPATGRQPWARPWARKEKVNEVNEKGLLQRYSAGERDFAGADLRSANLRGINLYGANLSGADLSGADLYGAYLAVATLYEADLRWADLTGADLTGADLTGASLSKGNLTGADLAGANLRWANLRWANLTGADLTEADLTGADLSEADLAGADLAGANLTGADLTGATLS